MPSRGDKESSCVWLCGGLFHLFYPIFDPPREREVNCGFGFSIFWINTFVLAVNVAFLSGFWAFLSDNLQAVHLMSTNLTYLEDVQVVPHPYHKSWEVNIPMLVFTWSCVSTTSLFFFTANSFRTNEGDSQGSDYRGYSMLGSVKYRTYVVPGLVLGAAFILIPASAVAFSKDDFFSYNAFTIPFALVLFLAWFATDQVSSPTSQYSFTPGPHEYARYTFYPMYFMWLAVSTLANDLTIASRDFYMTTSVGYTYMAAVVMLLTMSRKKGAMFRAVFVVGVLASVSLVRASVVEPRGVTGSNIYLFANIIFAAAFVIPVVEIIAVGRTDRLARLNLLRLMLFIEFISRVVLSAAVMFDVYQLEHRSENSPNL